MERNWSVYNDSERARACAGFAKFGSLNSYLEAISKNLNRRSFNTLDKFINPFQLPKGTADGISVSLDVIIKYLVVTGLQFDILESQCFEYGTIPEMELFYEWIQAMFPTIRVSHSKSYTLGLTNLVVTENDDWYVATCDGNYNCLSFRFFMTPYDFTTWPLLQASIFTATFLVLAVTTFLSSQGASFSSQYHLGRSSELCPNSGKRLGVKRSRWLVSCLRLELVSAVFFGAYQGVFVSERTHWSHPYKIKVARNQ